MMTAAAKPSRSSAIRSCASLLILAATATSATADTRALLVGVSDYVEAKINDPAGAANDVAAMRLVLVQRLGVAEKNIHTLTGRAATREAILAELSGWLMGDVKRGDHRLFYFSGHGSHVPDTSGDETDDHLDEVLCPADYSQRTGANAILDDELGRLLNASKGVNLLVIADACHAGTATKSVNGRLHDLPMAPGGPFSPRYLPPPASHGAKNLKRRQWNTKGISIARDLDHVLMAGCRDYQVAHGAKFRIGKRFVAHGAFTYMLLQGLGGRADANHDGQITYRELDAFTDRAISESPYQFTQRPELRAQASQLDRVFLGATLKSTSPRLSAGSGGRIRIDVGALDGLAPGDALRLQERGVRRHLATVEEVDAFAATVRMDEPAAEGLDARLNGQGGVPVHVAVQPAERGEPRLRVWVGEFFANGEPALPPRRLVSTIGEMSGVVLVGEPAEADRIITGVIHAKRIETLIALRSMQIVGRFAGAVADVARDMTDAIDAELLKHELQMLESPGGSAAIELRVAGGRSAFGLGEEIKFEVDVSRTGYLVILTIDSLGTLEVLYPSGDEPESLVQGGRTVLIPSEGSGFLIKEPTGHDMLKAIWSSEPLSLAGGNTKSLKEAGSKPKNRAAEHAMLDELRSSIRKFELSRTRSKGFVPAPADRNGLMHEDSHLATSTLYIDTFRVDGN